MLASEEISGLDQAHAAKVLYPVKVLDVISYYSDSRSSGGSSDEHVIRNTVFLAD